MPIRTLFPTLFYEDRIADAALIVVAASVRI